MGMPPPNRTGFWPNLTIRLEVACSGMTPWLAASECTPGRLARCGTRRDGRPMRPISATGSGAMPGRVAAGHGWIAAGREWITAERDRVAAGRDRIESGGDNHGSSSGAQRGGWITPRRGELPAANRGQCASHRLTHQSGTSPAGFTPDSRKRHPPGIGRTPKGRQ